MRKFLQPLTAVFAVFCIALPAQAQSYGSAVAVSDGAVFVAERGGAVGSGAVYVYRTGADGEWAEVSRLTAPDPEPRDGFGSALAADGNVLLAGMAAADEDRGSVYVFERDEQAQDWTRTGTITADDGVPGDGFGVAVALSGDYALITAQGAAEDEGSTVYVFRRDGEGWTQEARLSPSEAGEDKGFGAGLALDGERALIGAPSENEATGAAYLFQRDASGAWTESARMVSQTAEQGDALGASVLLTEARAFVAAPRQANGTGAVYIFAEDEDEAGEWSAFTRLLPFEGNTRASFGAHMAMVNGELWVGSPGAESFSGAIYRMQHDAERDAWVSASKLRYEDLESGDRFAGTFAANGETLVVGLPGDDNGAGTAVIFGRDAGGDWTGQTKVWSEPASLAAVTGGQVDCTGGEAAHFDCAEVDLVSFMPVKDIGGERGINLNDVWGWVDPETGREYALVGRIDGTSFVDITDPASPVYLGDLPLTEGANTSTWRDIKVYEDHAFIVADGAGEHGMQVFDLTQLRDVGNEPVTFEATAHYDRIASAHNIVINEDTGFAYSVGSSGGGDSCGGGLHMIDIRDPLNPTFAGCFADAETGRASTGYSHDAQCVTYDGPDEEYVGREICLGANETALSIADVTDKDNPVALSRASYPNVGYTHQGWLTEDHRYFYMNDELDELQGLVSNTRTLIWDLAELEDPQLVGEFMGPTEASDHNLYVRGDRMYQSNYQSGLRVIDISDPEDPSEVGYFDTVPYGENTAGFGGSWSNYPFFPSGVIIVTSGDEGLFVLRSRTPVT